MQQGKHCPGDTEANRSAWLARALHSLANNKDCPASLAFLVNLLGDGCREVAITKRLVAEFANARKDLKVCLVDEARQTFQRLRRAAAHGLRELDIATRLARGLANEELTPHNAPPSSLSYGQKEKEYYGGRPRC